MNFRAPGNGFEMQNLFGAMVRAGITKVWVNYHDLNWDGAWQQRTQRRTFYRWTGTTDEKTPRAATWPPVRRDQPGRARPGPGHRDPSDRPGRPRLSGHLPRDPILPHPPQQTHDHRPRGSRRPRLDRQVAPPLKNLSPPNPFTRRRRRAPAP